MSSIQEAEPQAQSCSMLPAAVAVAAVWPGVLPARRLGWAACALWGKTRQPTRAPVSRSGKTGRSMTAHAAYADNAQTITRGTVNAAQRSPVTSVDDRSREVRAVRRLTIWSSSASARCSRRLRGAHESTACLSGGLVPGHRSTPCCDALLTGSAVDALAEDEVTRALVGLVLPRRVHRLRCRGRRCLRVHAVGVVLVQVAAVQRVIEDGMAHVLEVQSDLVSASRHRAACGRTPTADGQSPGRCDALCCAGSAGSTADIALRWCVRCSSVGGIG